MPRSTSLPPTQRPGPGLLDVPVEVMYLISDWLSLRSKYCFSHVCKATYHILWEKTAADIDRLEHGPLLTLLTSLTDAFAHTYPCVFCKTLHLIREDDIPLFWENDFRVPLDNTSCCIYDRRNRILVKSVSEGTVIRWKFQHHHVRLALQYWMLGTSHQEYLSRLMAPFLRYATDLYRGIQTQVLTRPVIVEERFLLYCEVRIRVGPTFTGFFQRPGLYLCPHSLCWLGGPLLGPAVANWPNHASLSYHCATEQIAYGSCQRCPTDWAVLFKEETLYIGSWKDFGYRDSPPDIDWWIHRAVPFTNTSRFGLPPGDVRNKYLAVEPLPSWMAPYWVGPRLSLDTGI
jgi:hypothetical protein